jgi:hypothetical protein
MIGLPIRRTIVCKESVSFLSVPLVLHDAQSGQAEPTVNVGCERTTSGQPVYSLAPNRPWFFSGSRLGAFLAGSHYPQAMYRLVLLHRMNRLIQVEYLHHLFS